MMNKDKKTFFWEIVRTIPMNKLDLERRIVKLVINFEP